MKLIVLYPVYSNAVCAMLHTMFKLCSISYGRFYEQFPSWTQKCVYWYNRHAAQRNAINYFSCLCDVDCVTVVTNDLVIWNRVYFPLTLYRTHVFIYFSFHVMSLESPATRLRQASRWSNDIKRFTIHIESAKPSVLQRQRPGVSFSNKLSKKT